MRCRVPRIKVERTTLRSRSGRNSASRSKPATRVQSPTNGGCACCAWRPTRRPTARRAEVSSLESSIWRASKARFSAFRDRISCFIAGAYGKRANRWSRRSHWDRRSRAMGKDEGGFWSALAWLAFPLVPALLGNTYQQTFNSTFLGEAPDPRQWGWFSWILLGG